METMQRLKWEAESGRRRDFQCYPIGLARERERAY